MSSSEHETEKNKELLRAPTSLSFAPANLTYAATTEVIYDCEIRLGGKYRVGVRKGIASWEPRYAVNDGKACFGLFWARKNAELTRDLLNGKKVKR